MGWGAAGRRLVPCPHKTRDTRRGFEEPRCSPVAVKTVKTNSRISNSNGSYSARHRVNPRFPARGWSPALLAEWLPARGDKHSSALARFEAGAGPKKPPSPSHCDGLALSRAGGGASLYPFGSGRGAGSSSQFVERAKLRLAPSLAAGTCRRGGRRHRSRYRRRLDVRRRAQHRLCRARAL